MKTFIFGLLIILLPFHALSGELETREAIHENVRNLLSEEDYAALEALASEYREKESRTASGVWKLTVFYTGVNNILPYSIVDPDIWNSLLTKVDRWQQQFPRSPTPYIAKSLILKKQAWSIRGTGYSGSVDSKSWEPFYNKVSEARRVLEDSRAISINDPAWYEVMVEIATIESWDDKRFEALIEKGLQENPYYYELYFSILNHYTPKWHGDSGKIEQFARQSIQNTKTIEGYGLYARIYWYASQSQFEGQLFQRSDVDWPTMSRGIDDVLSKYPDQWNINNFTKFACLASDRKKARQLFELIKGEPIYNAWLQNQLFYKQCREWSFSSGHIASDQVPDSVKIIKALPGLGSSLIAGSTVSLRFEIEYSLQSADSGSITLAIQDDNNELLGNATVEVDGNEGTVELKAKILIPDTSYITVFSPLMPSGSSGTRTVDAVTYEVVRK